jgi:hypothetical protein
MKKIILKITTLFFILVFLISSFPPILSQNILEKNIQSKLSDKVKAWTSLYYLDVDWESYNIDILETKFIDKISSGENLNVLVLQDREKDPAFLYYIDENHNKILLEELGEVNMADPETLSNFITYGKEHYPAERYQLCIWSHANAWYGACVDETSGGDIMTMDEFQQAFKASNGVDLLCFIGCCQMGSLEAVYELKDLCDVYVGHEDDGYGPQWYDMLDEMCALLNNDTSLSTIEYGEHIVNYIDNNPNEFEEELTISAIRTDRIEGLVDEIEKLSIILFENDDVLYENLISARAVTRDFDFIQDSYLLDIYDFVDKYLEIETNQYITQILTNINKNLSEAIIAEAHGESQLGSNGLSIFYSTRDMISFYADIDLDFSRDTHWDDLLDKYKEKSDIEIDYLINYNSYLKLFINTSSINKPILINEPAILPVTVEYWTNIPNFFKKIPFRFRNYFLFGTFIGPLQEINFDIKNIPVWANIYVNTSFILTTIPYEGKVREVSADLIINITDEDPKESYRIDIIAECDDIKRLNGCDIQWSLEFTLG